MTPDTRTPPEDLQTPLPSASPAFKAKLRAQLLEAHAARRKAVSWERIFLISLPFAAAAFALFIVFRPANQPFSPVEFLQRAEAAAVGYEHGVIYYEKIREILGKDAPSYDGQDPLPVTKETWSLIDGRNLYWITRWSHDDGKVTDASLNVYPAPEYVHPAAQYIQPLTGDNPAVCVEPALFAPADPNDPFLQESDAKAAAVEQFNILLDLEDKDASRRVRALRVLMERGDAVYEGSYAADGRTLRAFRVKIYDYFVDEQNVEDSQLHTNTRFQRIVFDDADHSLHLREDWEVYDGKEHQTVVTEYLDSQIIDKHPAEVFDPKRLGLVSIWDYVPAPRESFAHLQMGEQVCFLNGKRYEHVYEIMDEGVTSFSVHNAFVRVTPPSSAGSR